MKYEIWQLPLSNKAKFNHYDWIKEKPTITDYVMVYSGKCEPQEHIMDLLENLFYIFNEEHPSDYHAASLSVSDLVCLIDTNNKREWWFVDGFGFKNYNDDINI